METVNLLSALVTLYLMCGVRCTEDVELLNERLNVLNDGVKLLSDRLATFETQVSIENAILSNKQEERILSLKTELKNNIWEHVTTALSEILRSESFEDIIKSEVVSEMRHLKRTNHQMRRQLHQMMTSLGQVREDNRVYGEALQKGERENAELMSCSKHYGKSEFLTVQLAERDLLISELKQKLSEKSASCIQANKTKKREANSDSDIVTKRLIEHDNQISQLNRTLMTLSKESGSALNSSTQTSSTSTTLSPSTQLTTPDPQEERSRILVAPMWSFPSHQFRQVNINSNSLENYSYLNLKHVESVVYISKLDSILIGLSSPNKIISSKLLSSRTVTVRHNVRTWGMAADEKRGIIFLTTRHPSYTISRMSLQGRHYTAVVRLVGYGIYPRAIAVHSDTQMIYSCNGGKLFSTTMVVN